MFNKKSILTVVILILVFNPSFVQAKGGDEQDQIVLLNDSAAALEDSNPDISKDLTQFADEKEKDWENNNANKNASPAPVTAKDVPQLQEHIKLLKEAVIIIQPTYPLIAKGLNQMVKEMEKVIEGQK